MIKIEKNIPMPTSEFPIAQMEVGDSFLITIKQRQSVRVHCAKFAVKGWEFKTRTVSKNQVRIWRTK